MVQKQTLFIVFVLSLVTYLILSQQVVEVSDALLLASERNLPICTAQQSSLSSTNELCVPMQAQPAKNFTVSVRPMSPVAATYSANTALHTPAAASLGSYGGGLFATVATGVGQVSQMKASYKVAASPRLMKVARRSATVNLPQMPSTVAAPKPVYTAPTKATVIQPLSLGYASASQYISAAPAVHRAPGNGVDNALNNWLIYGSGSGALVSGDASTGYYYDMATLQELFNQMQANGDMPGMTWEQFLDWFNNGSQNRHFAPMGDACWMLALLALGYGVLVYRKHKRQTMITE